MNGYRITISAYAAIAFAAVSLVTDRFDRLVYGAAGTSVWRTSPPDYPLGAWAAAFALPLGVVFYFLPAIARAVRLPNAAITKTITAFGVFLAFICLLLPNFGLHAGYLMWGIAFGSVLAFTEGLRAYVPDLAFVTDPRMASAAKIAKLGLMAEKLFRALTMFLAICVAGLVSGALQMLAVSSSVMGKVQSGYAITAMGIMIFCLSPGIALGVVWQVFQKISRVEDAHVNVRDESPGTASA